MSRSKKGAATVVAEGVETRSPAEFFAEHQNIAGFDNAGKSLFTTIREFVENSLDAAEAIHVLPDITITVSEMDTAAFNELRGVKTAKRKDLGLYAAPKGSKKRRKSETTTSASQDSTALESSQETQSKKGRGDTSFFKITCRDNGTGMKHSNIPNMLGRVLAGSKYGVRQTRGKFGLGAKMALIWSKKSTGMPIEVKTAHSTSSDVVPLSISHCILDIDIQKNEPTILKHVKVDNDEDWRGSEISVVIGGNWTTYQSRVKQYLQQLAIITPYAQFELRYECPHRGQHFSLVHERRSDQMPPLAREVKPHPSSLNELLLKQLIKRTKATTTLIRFLTTGLSCVDRKLADRIVIELGAPFEESSLVHELHGKQIHKLTKLMKSMTVFKAPSGDYLSPAGEYNLCLGVMKELTPTMVATHTEAPGTFEGHAFIVEAAVSIGGNPRAKEGLSIYRFANRIPLLFEAGGDVVTRTANSIKWSSYKIDHKKDKVGVFVSIVSTKIPFKGTGKEYVGDDIYEIKMAVKHALQQCCSKLKTKLLKSNKEKENAQRKKNLTKYIPDVARAVFGLIQQMKERREKAAESNEEDEDVKVASKYSTNNLTGYAAADKDFVAAKASIIQAMEGKEISEKFFQTKLHECVNAVDESALMEQIASNGRDKAEEQRMYIMPLDKSTRSFHPRISHKTASISLFSNVVS